MINYKEYITLNPKIRFGKPIIIGTRISVYDVLNWLASGLTVEGILTDFPELTKNQILACLSYAAERENKTLIAS